jgi:hypothetical protein
MDQLAPNPLDYEVQVDGRRVVAPHVPRAQRAALPLTIIGTAFMLWAARLPVADIGTLFLGFVFVAVAAWCWLITVSRHYQDHRLGAPILIVIPSIVVLMIVVISLGLPPMMTFHIHKPALDRWAKAWLTNPNPPTAARVGTYEIYDIDHFSGGLRGYLRDSDSGTVEGGLVYSPTVAPVSREPETYKTLTGGWYFLYNDN